MLAVLVFFSYCINTNDKNNNAMINLEDQLDAYHMYATRLQDGEQKLEMMDEYSTMRDYYIARGKFAAVHMDVMQEWLDSL